MLYKSIVEPIATYGAECWTVGSKYKSKLEALEMDHLRRSARPSRLEHVPNQHIRDQMGITITISDRIAARQLK